MVQFSTIFNLHEGEDNRERVRETIQSNISFKGANLWILACAIIVACVGLNVNSTAVIIGAMLISPLMGPILGAGFSLGIYDFKLLKRSLKNLFIATVVSLTVSTVYFLLTPFKDVQSELLARTAPNIYDIFIAFFGGLVGVIAVTRTEKGNPVPGVAIATALMPPLCTAGYGIATAQWAFFLGAFYLYCINCVFIGIATFLIIKYLKYPAVKQVDQKQQKQVRFFITLLIVIMLVPSSYLAYMLYTEQQFKKNAEMFIEREFTSKGHTVVYKKSDFKSAPKKLDLAFLNKRFDSVEIATLKNKISNNIYLRGTMLTIRQDSTDRLSILKGDILSRIKSNENEVNEKDVHILQLEQKLANTTFDNKKLFKEAAALFPAISSLSVSRQSLAMAKDSIINVTAVIVRAPKGLPVKEKEKLAAWLNERLSVKNTMVFTEQ